jgi:uncharacterized protein
MSALRDALLAQWLSDNGFAAGDVNSVAASGLTPVLKASRNGDADILRELIAKGAAVDAKTTDGNNALWLACKSDDLETIETLVAAGVDVNFLNRDGATALIYASSAGKAPVVEHLLRLGADPAPETVDGFSALDLASTPECLALLRPPRRRVELQTAV